MNTAEGLDRQRADPNPEKNSPSSQEKLPTPERITGIGRDRFKRGIRFGAAVLLFATTLLSPIDSPQRSVKAESNPQQANTLPLLHGDGSRNRLNIMLLRDVGVTDKMVKEVAEDLFLIPPTDEFKDRVNVYQKDPQEDLKCDQDANCNFEAVQREKKRAVDIGLIPHQTLIVIKSTIPNRGAGVGGRGSEFLPPDIYVLGALAAVVRPENIPTGFTPDIRKFHYGGILAHELWGHAFANFVHEGGDIMASPIAGNFFNPQHTQYLRDLMRLTPYNYLLPKNGIIIESMGTLSAKGELLPPPQRAIAALVSTPLGTKQLYSEVKTHDGEGLTVVDYVNDPGLIHAWSEIGKKIPLNTLSAAKEYRWRVCSSGSSIPLSPKGPDHDLRWEKVEGWPGVFFPNPCAEVNFRAPDGKYRVYLPITPR